MLLSRQGRTVCRHVRGTVSWLASDSGGNSGRVRPRDEKGTMRVKVKDRKPL